MPVKTSDDPVCARLQRDITSLYLEDFAAQWDRLSPISRSAPFGTVSQATQILNVLSAPDSPLRALMVSAAEETWLSHVPDSPAPPPGSDLAQAAALAAQQAAKAAEKNAPKASPRGQEPRRAAACLGSLRPSAAADDVAGPFTDKPSRLCTNWSPERPPRRQRSTAPWQASTPSIWR